MDAALRFLNQTLTDVTEITVEVCKALTMLNTQSPLQDILAIHKRVLGFVDPISAGVIRKTQVYVGGFTPCAPHAIHGEMEALVDWLNDDETYVLDPIKVAAIAHYKLVSIYLSIF